jgi:hypothetical protein
MEAFAHPLFTSTQGLPGIAKILPGSAPISGAGKIPDMIWLAKWGFGGGFKIIRPRGFMTAGPSFQVRRSGAPELLSSLSASRRRSSCSRFAASLWLERKQSLPRMGLPSTRVILSRMINGKRAPGLSLWASPPLRRWLLTCPDKPNGGREPGYTNKLCLPSPGVKISRFV